MIFQITMPAIPLGTMSCLFFFPEEIFRARNHVAVVPVRVFDVDPGEDPDEVPEHGGHGFSASE